MIYQIIVHISAMWYNWDSKSIFKWVLEWGFRLSWKLFSKIVLRMRIWPFSSEHSKTLTIPLPTPHKIFLHSTIYVLQERDMLTTTLQHTNFKKAKLLIHEAIANELFWPNCNDRRSEISSNETYYNYIVAEFPGCCGF